MEAGVYSPFQPQDRVNRGEMTKYIKRNTQDLTDYGFFLLTSRQTTRLFWFTDKSNKELLSVCIKVSFPALERLGFRAFFCTCMRGITREVVKVMTLPEISFHACTVKQLCFLCLWIKTLIDRFFELVEFTDIYCNRVVPAAISDSPIAAS